MQTAEHEGSLLSSTARSGIRIELKGLLRTRVRNSENVTLYNGLAVLNMRDEAKPETQPEPHGHRRRPIRRWE